MHAPALSFSSARPSEDRVEVIVIGAVKDADGPRLLADASLGDLGALLPALGVGGATGELARIPDGSGAAAAIAIVGIGSQVTPDALRDAAGSAVRQLAGSASVGFAFGELTPEQATALAEGAALGAYAFTEYRSASLAGRKAPVERVVVFAPEPSENAAERIRIVIDAVDLTRDLVNTPPNDLFPESFADRVLDDAARLGLATTVWTPDELVRDGFGGIVGVGQGASRGPRLVKVEYAPADARVHLALVGKGITFDSGGLSLKPMAAMVGMKSDMAGAAGVYAALAAAARLALPVRLTAWLCLAENMPSATATRPNDVLRIRGGRTVEVVNTDAEGRLVLADGLVAAGEERPDAIIDLATLTGAQVVALGHTHAAVMGDETLVDRVLVAAASVGELAWPMPLPPELRGRLDSDVADLKNATPGDTAAGMLLAGVFLKEFVADREGGSGPIPWAHIDIAGTALNEGKPRGAFGPGATGSMVRTLVAVASSYARR